MADRSKSHEPQNSPSRRALRSFFSCKYHKDHTEQKQKKHKKESNTTTANKTTSLPEVSKRRASTSESHIMKSMSTNSSYSLTTSSTNSSIGGSFRVMHLRRLSGCYECRMVIDPISGVLRDGSGLRGAVTSCDDCGEIFLKADSLELHQSIRHAVSELGEEDTSKNIIQIIFQSSWLKKQTPTPKIDRILKIHNTKSTTSNFELYRNIIKMKAANLAKKHPRCIADGNELLRFYCTTFTCDLGLNGHTSLCCNFSRCKACSIVKDGVKAEDGCGMVRTWGMSGKAHDGVVGCLNEGEKRAMLVCRVIAGRVKKGMKDGLGDKWDSISDKEEGSYADFDELFVADGRAVLPCFVVVYRDF